MHVHSGRPTPAAQRPQAAFDLVIFDCDGVLIDSEHLASRVTADLLTACGYPITPKAFARRFNGVSAAEMRRIVGEERREPLPADFAERDAQTLVRVFETELLAIDGAAAFLEASPMPACVASGSSMERLQRTLTATGLARFFTGAIFSADDVPRGKPSPDVFLKAAEVMAAAPERCLVIEDSVADVTAGRAAGMTVLGFLGGSHCSPDHGALLASAGAHRLCASYGEVAAFAGVNLTGSLGRMRARG